MANLNVGRTEDDSDESPSMLSVLAENHGRFLTFLNRRVRHSHDAEEILQAALARLIERDPVVAEETVTAWFYRVLRNAVADFYRRQAAASRALDRWQEDQARMTDDEDLQRAVCACVGELLPTLKPEYAQLLARVELGGESLQAAAKSLNLTPNNGSVRLHRARLALKKRLEDTCRACATHGCFDCTCKES